MSSDSGNPFTSLVDPVGIFDLESYKRNSRNPLAAIDPFVGTVRLLREGYNEATGANKQREKKYQNQVVADAKAAKAALDAQENAQRQEMDLSASFQALRGRMRGKGRGASTLMYDNTLGSKDYLGL